ncbi:DNA-processing protein DprA [Candidatus Saccharibacteria bacterium]|nr:DNA-processing protein DprA [Candidatus Saccharibacteria bacterium]
MSTLFSHFFQKINQISPLEHDFTEVLDTIALKPKTLYFYGKLPQNVSKLPENPASDNKQISLFQDTNTPKITPTRPKTVAIVGSRHNTRYGQEVAYSMAYKLAQNGVVIISGLAYGIDSIAHRATLDAGGTTIAILGTPIDRIYPANHTGLATEIIKKGGAIISEYAPRTTEYQQAPLAPAEAGRDGDQWVNPLSALAREDSTVLHRHFTHRKIDPYLSFLYRNRLISGLSDIVVVVEAAQKSGSLNTATHALEQGKDVFAVPGNITAPYSQGCNRLIAQGATPYQTPDDILRILFPEKYLKKSTNKHKIKGDTPIETAILQVIAEDKRNGEEIMKQLKLPVTVFNQTITMLEIKGLIRALGANNWALN